MRYSIDYQQVSQGQLHAKTDTCPADIIFNSNHGLALIPCVGDVINLPSTAVKEGVCGIVRSRIFNYLRGQEELYCHVNILVEEADINFGNLISEYMRNQARARSPSS
ncbi:hypothetical protein AL532_07425 [Pseudomonas monteilii]|jgi:hypothetical protein|uniref:hypothetical protein n=1 Tax=Pseudomonas TaxID=286 RepID=UPI000CEB7AB6|nr:MULTISPECIES: hypothetical protein [Pseudomonas]AVH36142.1 hypothetical protein AL532_07425 [Pseudomonas monteilii]MBF8732436.1 hypothetical protein [Pseudomonas guariconensis]MBH3308132.1 hypothetical protein [Pseudomonas mosselii]MBH3323164.1 hypothetical protein [Pseudomonas mosselii]MBI6919814.1 hypothetical protein [Pseudomonas monteilii]